MKTVKEVSQITKVSIRTLRYYDEIGLLKPAQLTEAGYRLYDDKALEKLQQIMFFRELEIPLADIKHILENPNLDKKQVLKTQKALLEKKRNRLDGIIQLITDVMEGVNTMTFDAFSNDDIQKIINHTIECMSKDALEKHIKQYGSLEKYCEHLSKGFQNEQAMSDVIRWYGSKDKAVDAILQSTGNEEELNQQQNKNDEVYRLLIEAKEKRNIELEKEGIAKLAEVYKEMFKVDNARAILLDLGKEYLQNDMLVKAIDDQYGNGSAKFIAEAILRYYGE